MRRFLVGVGAALVVAGAIWWVADRAASAPAELPVPGDAVRITVEVLNGTTIDGLARSVTRRLRHQGIDVVYFGTAPAETLDTTLVIARRGDTSVARRVRSALGTGRVVVDEDARLLLDVSVILGVDAAAALRIRP